MAMDAQRNPITAKTKLRQLKLQADKYRKSLFLRASRTGRNHFYAPSLVEIPLLQAVAADMPA